MVPSAPLLRQACQVFLDIAYPAGPESIPEPLRVYRDIPIDADVASYLPPSPLAHGIAQPLTGPHPGYLLRLGCASFPFLKLMLQRVVHQGAEAWLCGVDTHDSWHHPEHPDAAAWLARQAANRELKTLIERAWEAAGLLTHNGLLRQELHVS